MLTIAPVAEEDRMSAELLLTRAFAGTAEERSRDLVRCCYGLTAAPARCPVRARDILLRVRGTQVSHAAGVWRLCWDEA